MANTRRKEYEIPFTRDARRAFCAVLGRVSCYSAVRREPNVTWLFLRPVDVQNFRENLAIRGLKNCVVTNVILTFLKENPTEFLQFKFER